MKKFSILVLCLAAAVTVSAQHMFDYSDIRSGRFAQKSVHGVRSMADGEHYTVNEQGTIVKYAYKTGNRVATVFDASQHPDLGSFTDYRFSDNENLLLITTKPDYIYRRSFTADHWIYDIRTGRLSRLSEKGREQVPQVSADGTKAAFVRNNDIWLVDLTTESFPLTRVTEDGRFNHIINGHTDWVYEEEYGFTRAFEFSPDGNRIAFLRFDESQVKEFTMMIYGKDNYTMPYSYKYPKAGEANSVVELCIYDIPSGLTGRIDTGSETDQYIPRIGWTPAGELFFYRVNRLQNHFEVLACDLTLPPRVIYQERDRRYIERPDDETVTFIPKTDRFIVKSERSGYCHLYLHNEKKGVLDTLTQGNWDVTSLVAVTGDRVYYMSAEESPMRRNLYSVKMNGKGKNRLTAEDGWFSVAPSSGCRYFISYYSNASTPNIVRLHDGSGKVLRVLEDNEQLRRTITERRVPVKEFFTIKTERSTMLNAYIIKPKDFDPDRKYPVLFTQYSGPGSQQVTDRWSIDWTDVLVQEGYLVVCVDGRGTGARGAEFRKCTYGKLGQLETEDQISAAKWMATQKYVDPDRIGIYGWSYGGFMALNCILKGNSVFDMAIAVAPVTSWRFYDTIYTEIYNGLPQDNSKGYDQPSPLNYPEMLNGKLLMIHGTADDNVHVQNTYRMADALTRAGRQFDMMIYTDDNHSMVPTGRHHVHEKMIDYTLNNL